MNFNNVINWIIPEGEVIKVASSDGTVLWKKRSTPAYDGLCFTALEDGSYGMSHSGTNQTTTIPKLQYSRDGINWTDWFFESISVKAGDKVYFKGDNPDGIGRMTTDYSTFTSTGRFAASGNIMSILGVDALAIYCFTHLFENCGKLIKTPELPTTTLVEGCYAYMFRGCTELTAAPKLPAAALAYGCYGDMFRDCTSLTTAPELPATTLAGYCYSRMFYGCTTLAVAPKLPATKLAGGGCYYQMFYDCTSLTIAPELPAVKLVYSCYYEMFRGCTSLTIAPELPATTLVNDCYDKMFYGCTKLNSIKHSVVNWNTSHTSNWLYNVAATGVMRCPTNSTIPSNNASGIPSGWSRVNF